MSYKYQLHTHTSPCSLCAQMPMEALIEALHNGGYQGCVITNHFMHGNSGIDRSLSWADFVKSYEEDYLLGKSLAEKYDLDMIFGIEEGVGSGLEILCYGITPQILYDHPELNTWDVAVWSRVLRENGALMIQAHPFRERSYIPAPGLLPPEYIDGIEVINAGQPERQDAPAKKAAEAHPEWILVAGADTHWSETVCQSGIECGERIRDEQELVKILKSGNYSLIKEW